LKLLKRQPARRQVLVITCLVLVPLATAIGWSAHLTVLERETEVREEAGAMAVTGAALLDQHLDSLNSFAMLLLRQRPVLDLNGPESDILFAGLLSEHPSLVSIVLTDTNGIPIASTPKPPAQSDRAYVRQVVSSGASVVEDLATAAQGGVHTATLAYPVRDSRGAIVGVLGLGLGLTSLQNVFGNIPLPDGSVIAVTDRSRRVIARSQDAETFIGSIVTDADRDSVGTGARRTTLRTDLDGVERFFGESPVGRAGWNLGVGIPRAVVWARLWPLWRRNLVISIIGLGTFLIVSLWFAHVTVRNANRLRIAAERIASGDLSPPQGGQLPSLEFSQLQDAFVTMAASLREARASLDRQMEQERKMNETLQSLQRQVVRQERLAAVGVLVSGVAHELNNPLQAILGTSEILERDGGVSPEVLEEISFIKTQSGRAREIIRNLSRFSTQKAGPPTLVDLRDVIAEVIQLRRTDLDIASVSLEVKAESTRKVYASFTELEQVTLNFVINAQQAIESLGSKGRILIRLFDMGKKVRLEVHDNGPGVKPEDEHKLFQPFFTTKPVGKGTGLGLSVSYGIIESYGGAIGYRGNEMGGAMFFFELPASEKAESMEATVSHGGTKERR
jgi:signal transduction histidine kinase